MTSKELLVNFKTRPSSKITSVQIYEFATSYTRIPRERTLETHHSSNLSRENGSCRYKYTVSGYGSTCLSNMKQALGYFYTLRMTVSMLEFLIDSIFVTLEENLGIPICTNCAPLHVLADLFSYSYEPEYVQN